MKAFFLALAGSLIATSATAVPSTHPGYCKGLRAIENSRYIYGDLSLSGESCDTVYVGPNHASAEVVATEFDTELSRICGSAAQLIDEMNDGVTELAKLDYSTEEGLARGQVISESNRQKLNEYKQLMTAKPGAKMKIRYNTHWSEDLARIRANNPEVRVHAMPFKKVSLSVGLYSSPQAKEAYLESIPAIFGFEYAGKTHFVWDNVGRIDSPRFRLTPQADKVELTAILGPVAACQLIKGEKIRPALMVVQGYWDTLDDEARKIEKGLVITLDGDSEN